MGESCTACALLSLLLTGGFRLEGFGGRPSPVLGDTPRGSTAPPTNGPLFLHFRKAVVTNWVCSNPPPFPDIG